MISDNRSIGAVLAAFVVGVAMVVAGGDGREAASSNMIRESDLIETDGHAEDVSDAYSVVEMITQPHCPACDRWWLIERPKWERQGWVVVKIDATVSDVRVTPTFRIRSAGRLLGNVSGYMTTAAGRRIVSGDANASPTRSTLANGRHQVRSEWTFSGGIADHLMGPNHRIGSEQLVGKSQAELERMHSADHRLNGRVPAATRGRLAAQVMQPGCPTGQCPTMSVRAASSNQGGGLIQRIRNRRR